MDQLFLILIELERVVINPLYSEVRAAAELSVRQPKEAGGRRLEETQPGSPQQQQQAASQARIVRF